MKKGWNKLFKERGIIFQKPHEDMLKVAKFLKKEHSKKVLDLGCGSGRHTIFLAEKGFEMYGTDSAASGINLCRKWLKKLGLKAKLKVASFTKRFPFRDNFFDAVISTWTIHHAKEKQVKFCIKEIERVLKPKGVIYMAITSTFKGRPIEEKKKIEPHTWIVTKGMEKGVPHHIFTKKMIYDYFKNFKIINLHKDKHDHWCFFGKLK